ncbi:response regulator [Salegentibacter sp. F188]|uniref:Response regulator n=1 Tax=Autumnicola patrickiae TaxID=3075591 RepID=A0ABU3DZY5_9FLAO|nr:response regulator [Salegentibacter sp. F188]MDT0689271.1 response regulator [Salegentibacter sp. F188]
MRLKKKICVIDDDEIYQMIMRRVIGKADVFEGKQHFCNAMDALREFQDLSRTLPDLILLDINMPGIDGWQFIEELREKRPEFEKKTRLYIVTSSIAQSDQIKAKSYKEVFDFISKPISVDQLRAIADSLY